MRISVQDIDAFAHCPDPRCDGYAQQPVKAQHELVEQTFRDNDGDMPGIERTFEYVKFGDAKDQPCPICGRNRELTTQRRVAPNALSGHPQNGLLAVKASDGTFREPVKDDRLGELERQVRELTQALIDQRTASEVG